MLRVIWLNKCCCWFLCLPTLSLPGLMLLPLIWEYNYPRPLPTLLQFCCRGKSESRFTKCKDNGRVIRNGLKVLFAIFANPGHNTPTILVQSVPATFLCIPGHLLKNLPRTSQCEYYLWGTYVVLCSLDGKKPAFAHVIQLDVCSGHSVPSAFKISFCSSSQ